MTEQPSSLGTASDEFLEAMLRDAELPSLMPALAYLTGDLELVADDVRPVSNGPTVVLAPQGGLTPDQQHLARRRALAALARFRDGGCLAAAPPTSLEAQRALLSFMTGPVDDRYLPMLGFELGLPDDVDAPDWQASALGPGRSFRVAIIGAGMSGLAMAFRLQQAGVDFVVFERNDDVGGVWLENRYPGCRLDTSNFCYSYSFLQRDDWPHQYSLGSEIREYFQEASDKLGLRERVRFRTEVTAARFDETAGEWEVTVTSADGGAESLRFGAVISAVGQLNTPSFPDIPGREQFAGRSFHSARWDESVDLSGLRVGVIGSGASAYQVVPSIGGSVGSLHLFQRTPPWTVPTPNYHAGLAPGLEWLFAHVPYYHRWFRFYQFWTSVEGRRDFAAVDPEWTKPGSVSAKNEALRQTLTAHLLAEYEGRPDLQEKMIPPYPPYGKRMLRDNGAWARTLTQDNTELVTERIERITPSGVLTADGVEHELDVLIYCTGFRAFDFLAGVEVTGRGGADLHEQWGSEPCAYLGITVPNFPNLFCLYGPNTNLVVNGSIVMFSECAVHYVLESVRLLLATGHRAMELLPEVLASYQFRVDEANALMAWGVAGVDNWYKGPSGRVTQNWPLSTLEYWELTRRPDEEHYEFL
ncbi:MAG: 4-hydroxyacetophenone monooxygenase [Frankiales bacterium]|nr:4-hydroxyacetophenone monooxygenase [Frankiales bacterium]